MFRNVLVIPMMLLSSGNISIKGARKPVSLASYVFWLAKKHHIYFETSSKCKLLLHKDKINLISVINRDLGFFST